ncbi:MAG: hypothetical protein KA715_14535 [Xanthomonadaceae bacterium]|nr:hypothetical protein [Xanthomonadaceae bacterium]
MKKFTLLLALLINTSNAHALTELGVIGGVTTNYNASSTMFFTYGLTAAIDLGIYSIGVKATNMSGPLSSVTVSNVTTNTNTGQVNVLGQFKFKFSGAFVGANIGMGIQNAYITVAGLSTGGSTATSLVYGLTAGYYMGSHIQYGVELDYNLSTLAGWTNNLVPMAGIKLSI